MSVKDLEIIKEPRKDEMGVARFHFSDRYSVFDWGRMPDLIDGKGAALCVMSAYCFERAEEEGIKTHYRGLVQEGKLIKTDELKGPTNVMEINLVNVYRPRAYVEAGNLKYDYSVFAPTLINFLIPLEFIYRNSLPKGSSVFKRLKEGLDLRELGLDHYPEPGEKLKKPILDVSTKLEKKDRYLTLSEAQRIVSLTEEEIAEIKETLLCINDLITRIASKAKLKNEDGKVEFALDPARKLMVVDAIGTLDECRFTYEEFHVSKEIVREYYRQTEWYKDLEEAKKEADMRGVEDWRSLCRSQPQKLDPRLKEIVCNLYMAAANECTGLNLFPAPRLDVVVEEYKAYLSERS